MEFINILQYELDKIDDIAVYEIEQIQEMLSSVEDAIKSMINDNNNLVENRISSSDNLEEINYSIHQLINNYIYPLNSPTRSDLYLFKTIENILKNPDIINTIISTHNMKEYLESSSKTYIYTSNMNENYQSILKDIFTSFNDDIPSNIKENLLQDTLSEPQKKILQNNICKFIKNFYNQKYNTMIKDGYVKRIVNSITVLDFIGTLPKNNNSNNSRLKTLKLEFLGFEYDNKDKNIKTKKPFVTDLMQPEFVKNFSVEELIAMCSFYSNRLAKSIYMYSQCLYTVHKTDLIKKILDNNDYSLHLSDEELSNILTQYKFLRKISMQFYDEKKKSNKKFEDINNDIVYKESMNPVIRESKAKYSSLYSEQFNKTLPNYTNNFLKDLNESIILESSVSYAYNIKNHSIESLLTLLMDKNKELNWGIILENNKNNNYYNNQNILIGVDMKEFNMPIKLHCSKEQIQNFLLNYTGKSIIPIYQGDTDMKVNGKYYSTQILFKLTKEQRKLLRKESESISKNSTKYKFVHHIQWMSLPKRYPEFLLNKNDNFSKKYFDMQTGKVITQKGYIGG